MLFIEAALLPGGSGQITLTGQLGAVMQESARAALSHIRQNAGSLGIPQEFLSKQDLHIHVPAGAIPKDGPSAGVTMATAIVSAARGVPVHSEVAMTGEITLSGLVLPVGGIREKALAARRHGIRTFILPQMNEPDLAELPGRRPQRDDIVPARTLEDVLSAALPAPAPERTGGEQSASTSPGTASATPRGRSRSSTRSARPSPATRSWSARRRRRWLFDRTLRVPARLLPGECDTGVVQLDSLHLDATATIRRAAALPRDAARARAGAKRTCCCASTTSRWW